MVLKYFCLLSVYLKPSVVVNTLPTQRLYSAVVNSMVNNVKNRCVVIFGIDYLCIQDSTNVSPTKSIYGCLLLYNTICFCFSHC